MGTSMTHVVQVYQNSYLISNAMPAKDLPSSEYNFVCAQTRFLPVCSYSFLQESKAFKSNKGVLQWSLCQSHLMPCSLGQGVADHGGEGEVVEAANGAAEILYGDVRGGKDEVDPVPVVDGEGFGLDGGGDGDDLFGWRGGETVLPPVGNGRGGGGAVVVGGDGEEEVLYKELLGGGPLAVPDEVNVDRGGEDGSHVVAEVDEVRRALEFLGGREGSGWELWVGREGKGRGLRREKRCGWIHGEERDIKDLERGWGLGGKWAGDSCHLCVGTLFFTVSLLSAVSFWKTANRL
ncbi:EXORDIUM like 5 [Actinidia rufa]|uniref:EXORDIUM like 5 n=1 Tax=Actinidia rufa TaxID=165716 RepID=A0A7J0DLG7_9ERIC|nr:EXORDIUM like 5 [Actinidia rufa]